jgi:CheY-like chemotaxis protein
MKKILIVDDDPDIVELATNRLVGNHYDVISSSTGEDGLKKAQLEKPDLIIMDILLPNMQGGEVVRYLKADQKTRNIPVIFLTAVASSNSPEQEERGINVDGKFFPAIPKPFKLERLLLEIKELI